MKVCERRGCESEKSDRSLACFSFRDSKHHKPVSSIPPVSVKPVSYTHLDVYKRQELCKKKQIDGIIDDGLFIYQNTIVAGVSAKRSQTKIGAVKVALFLDSASCKEVKAAIEEKQPGSILVLGTSVEMVDKIIRRLGLPMPEADSPRRIRIEDITTEEERKVARQQRDKLGKHVIPAPALQLKHNFAGYFMDPLRLFRGKDQGCLLYTSTTM